MTTRFTSSIPHAAAQRPVLPQPVHLSADGRSQTIFAALAGDAGNGDDGPDDRPVELIASIGSTDSAGPESAGPAAPIDTAYDPHAELNRLLLNVRAGCRRSFDMFYDKTRARLMRSVQNVIRNRDDAADVLQDVYTKVWGRSAQFQHEKGHALNWALGIAHHTAISSLRMRNARPQTAGAGDDDVDPYAGMESPWLAPDELAIREQARHAVHSAVHRLPDEHREALLLAFYEGLSYDEVATRMSRPLGTIKSWIRRSLAALQPTVGMHHEGYRPQPARPAAVQRRASAARTMAVMA